MVTMRTGRTRTIFIQLEGSTTIKDRLVFVIYFLQVIYLKIRNGCGWLDIS